MSQLDSFATSASMINKMRAGREDAWSRMVKEFGPYVLNCIKRIAKCNLTVEETSDISQEVFLIASQKIDSYVHKSGTGRSFRPWLLGITKNVLLRFFSNRIQLLELSPESLVAKDWVPEDLDEAGKVENEEVIWTLKAGNVPKAVEFVKSKTEPHVWQVFWRTTVNMESPQHVAEDLGMSGNCARKAKQRTTDRIQERVRYLNSLEEKGI